ncbi:molybdenum cofactor biosynthesis protein MoaE [uncultured Devosia sp.]|uniref:molybdenum cofactor biosynthesis protein MoaE n=1 Tax=uncultured Devosia sp. TaxID=211434 RepID=UPI0035CA6CEC
MDIRVLATAFDPGGETTAFLGRGSGAGAAVTFTGLVRSLPDHPILALTLECYWELAINQLSTIAATAIARFALADITVIHRYGRMLPGDPIVQVMTLSAHRQAAFDGAQMVMDTLKTDAPFWKKETTAAGEHWVEAKTADDHAKTRWD